MNTTSIQVKFRLAGITVDDDFALANDEQLGLEAKRFCQALNGKVAVAPKEWGKDFPLKSREEYEQVLQRNITFRNAKFYQDILVNILARSVSDEILGFIQPTLVEFFAETLMHFQDLASCHFLDKNSQDKQPKSDTLKPYSFRFLLANVCQPCGVMCHICHLILDTTLPTGHSPSPWIWVGQSENQNYQFNLMAQCKFVLEFKV
jgi:hypothetical protein